MRFSIIIQLTGFKGSLTDPVPSTVKKSLEGSSFVSFHLLLRKCLSITSVCVDGNVATLPSDLFVEGIVISQV